MLSVSTLGTLMKANGEDIKTIQELLRHSNYKVTADTYTQAVIDEARSANKACKNDSRAEQAGRGKQASGE